MTFIDALIIVVVIWSAWSGFRRGLIVSLFSLVGLVAGVLLGVKLAPVLMEWINRGPLQIGVGIAALVVCVGIGEYLGARVGGSLSSKVTWQPARAADRTVGMIGQTAAAVVLSWMIAVPLASTPLPQLTSAIRNSVILSKINDVMPAQAEALSAGLRGLLDDTGFPAILDPLAATPLTEVEVPDAALAGSPVAKAAQKSVLKVRSSAESCSRIMTGSSFVIGAERVLTNAHVVAGSERVVVEVAGESLPATVVLYDPELDVAVLDVPGLDRPTLPFDLASADTGTDAIVLGYPLDGPYTVSPGRIRSEFDLRGPDIYDSGKVVREVYIMRALVRPGNSGGPVLDDDGEVIGVVFGSAIDDPDTGFALTADQVQDSVAAGLKAKAEVATGACTAG